MCKNTVNNNNNNNRDIKISLQGPRQAGERRYKCDRK